MVVNVHMGEARKAAASPVRFSSHIFKKYIANIKLLLVKLLKLCYLILLFLFKGKNNILTIDNDFGHF